MCVCAVCCAWECVVSSCGANYCSKSRERADPACGHRCVDGVVLVPREMFSLDQICMGDGAARSYRRVSALRSAPCLRSHRDNELNDSP